MSEFHEGIENFEAQQPTGIYEEKRSNVVAGIIGACLGAILGVVLWVFVSMAGYIAGICGVAMLLAGFKGYELLGGVLDKRGMIICVIISILMIFLAVNIAFIAEIIRDIGFADTMEIGIGFVLEYGWTDPEFRRMLLIDLVMGYALYVFSGFTYIKRALSR